MDSDRPGERRGTARSTNQSRNLSRKKMHHRSIIEHEASSDDWGIRGGAAVGRRHLWRNHVLRRRCRRDPDRPCDEDRDNAAAVAAKYESQWKSISGIANISVF